MATTQGTLEETMERARLDAHFVEVLGGLRRRPLTGLSRVQRRARETHLERLEAYRRRGRFPRNTRFARTLPHFIDDFGTRCAMGHLIEQSGSADVVQYIARERNYERVRTLADIPELVAWLEENGLTAEEAGRIQPAYCSSFAFACVCSAVSWSAGGLVEGQLKDGVVKVTAVYRGEGAVVGEELPLSTLFPSSVPDGTVFAQVLTEGESGLKTASPMFGTHGDSVDVTAQRCMWWDGTEPPGPLPIGVFRSAITADNCESVVTTHDSTWSERHGPHCSQLDGNAKDGDAENGGCHVAHHGGGATALILVVSAAALAHGVRRHLRR